MGGFSLYNLIYIMLLLFELSYRIWKLASLLCLLCVCGLYHSSGIRSKYGKLFSTCHTYSFNITYYIAHSIPCLTKWTAKTKTFTPNHQVLENVSWKLWYIWCFSVSFRILISFLAACAARALCCNCVKTVLPHAKSKCSWTCLLSP